MLMKYGMPEKTAFGMRRDIRLAALIVVGTSEGGEWDWTNMKWRERD
jgi:hypothetical protein